MWSIFLRFLFFSLTFSFVTPFFFNFGAAVANSESAERQYGECSWYEADSAFRFPSGQRLNPNVLYAAHKTLPLGSLAIVTNPNNGKTVQVTITDRGPLVYGRIAALSKAAFSALGDLDQKVFDCYVAPVK
ncbi:unnamed protein product [Allacma fusca]|uniref:RlpA-like protein double-psi beta-barrel domain-containing protein n=1 Tax=Allacma fusca TaxID=39272 RepID=A0A8J2LFI9_9HEXA|nr:unnamed protein product [Allacma fusca]